MLSDCYRVDVIHFLNPSLIWVEVCNSSVDVDDFVFEQVGIYGIVPRETTIDVESESVVSAKCTDWVPAANTILKSILCKCEEVWFLPTHIDRRSSIFDDNIHKYGEFIIKNFEGKLKKVSKYLVKSGFAEMDVCQFHSQLSKGELNTKLDSIKTQEVIRHIEKYYTKLSKKKEWERSVKKQTSVFQMKQKFESELTVSNVEKHNNIMIRKVIENKSNDFELCKDIKEKPLGRGFHKSNSIKSELKSNVLKKLVSSHDKTTFDDIKHFLEAKSKPSNHKIIKDDDSECSATGHIEIVSKSLSRRLKRVTDPHFTIRAQDKTKKQTAKEWCQNLYENGVVYQKSKKSPKPKIFDKDLELDHVRNISTTVQKNEVATQDDDKGNEETGNLMQRSFKMKENGHFTKKLVAYGPPGLDPKNLKVKKLPIINTEDVYQEQRMDKGDIQRDSFQNVESEVDYKIDQNNVNRAIKICDVVQSDVKTSDSEQTVLSSVLQRRLRAHNSIRNNESSISSSDTNRESSSVGENKESFDDDEILEIIDKRYSKVPSLSLEINNSVEVTVKNNVNPFKNVDSSISGFVDKLVTPVLMVHSKTNKRIEPVFEIRDVHFNAHIRLVLRNMGIEKLMMLQTVSWQTILRGYSLFMVSPMGSGKTMGYLPAICRLVSDGSGVIVNSSGPMCIIVCATANSVAELEKLAKMLVGLDERVLACYAGVDDTYITTGLLNGCDLFICTPPALTRLLQVTDFGIDLRRLSMLVLDDCERLTQTYSDELKFFQIKINAMLKNRVNKELKVQYIISSRIWCDFMAPMAKKAPDTVVCIGAFQECVLYSKANTSVSFIKVANKLDHVFDFLNTIDTSKKTVIVCENDNQVELLQTALKDSKSVVFACDNNMTVHDLYTLSEAWGDYQEPVLGPILVCCDGNLTHMNITDAHYLIHYSLPQYYSTFCKRFAVLNDNYPSIFQTESENIKIKIFLEESNVQQLPKIVNFIKRCTENVPQYLDDICAGILTEKDLMKAQRLVSLCDNLLQLGSCPDFYNCQERHTILKDYDAPKEWVPKHGFITFKIIHYHTATLYSARLLSVSVNGTTSKFPQTYSTLSLKMGMYFGKESNRKLHGMPEIGDVCAVAIKLNFVARCQVLKILSRYQRGNPNKVLVKLIDEEKYEITRDIHLYYLPDDLKEIETKVVQIRLANLEPKDRDITFSDLARDHLKKITDGDDELVMRGQVALALGNCVFVTTLEACQNLSSLSETVVKYNFKHELLKNHGIKNSEHLSKIEALCKKSGLAVKEAKFDENKVTVPVKKLPKGSWAHLDSEDICSVFFASAINPGKFFVRLEKFEPCMTMLIEDIKNYVENNSHGIDDINVGDVVLAKFPDDSTYERAIIDSIYGDRVKCFFVDQGDWREVPTDSLVSIQEKFITKLPFQAIECRLVGVRPPGEEWTDFSTNWFYDNCFDNSEDLKHLFVKFYTKEPAEFTDGHKYGVVLIDTSTEQDIIINELMVDLNLARENEDEWKYFENIHSELKRSMGLPPPDEGSHYEEENTPEETIVNCSDTAQKFLRSVPLVNSDDESEDSDKWEVNMSTDTANKIFQTVYKNENAITNPNDEIMQNLPPKINLPVLENKHEIQDLTIQVSKVSETPEKPITQEINQKRRPKLIWRQNKSTVFIKIQLVVGHYNLKIDNRRLEFIAVANDTKYEFDFELFGVINKEKSTHLNKGQYILIKLLKVLNKNWLTLTRDGSIKKWVVYDVDFIDTSSDEEVIDENSVMNIVKSIHENADSESDDEEFPDDANFTYKKDLLK